MLVFISSGAFGDDCAARWFAAETSEIAWVFGGKCQEDGGKGD